MERADQARRNALGYERRERAERHVRVRPRTGMFEERLRPSAGRTIRDALTVIAWRERDVTG